MFGDEKDFFPEFSQTCPKKSTKSVLQKEKMLFRLFWTPLDAICASYFQGFAQIFRDFVKVLRYFAQISTDFHQIQTLGGALVPPAHRLLHQ